MFHFIHPIQYDLSRKCVAVRVFVFLEFNKISLDLAVYHKVAMVLFLSFDAVQIFISSWLCFSSLIVYDSLGKRAAIRVLVLLELWGGLGVSTGVRGHAGCIENVKTTLIESFPSTRTRPFHLIPLFTIHKVNGLQFPSPFSLSWVRHWLSVELIAFHKHYTVHPCFL